MDRLVDHIFAFEGDGHIRDFPGNYSQYRDFQEQQKRQIPVSKPQEQKNQPAQVSSTKKGLSFKEKFELEQLNKDLQALQQEKNELTEQMNRGDLEYAALNAAAERISTIVRELDNKELRWLELSEREEV
jgi:ATP-binding cassette subfamily F protein uup